MRIKISLINYAYEVRHLKNGSFYLTRVFTSRGLKKWREGKLPVRSGIIL